MTTGIVKWFNVQNGFGFILPEDGETEVYLPVTAIEHAGLAHVEVGQRVSFDLFTARDGRPVAGNLAIM